MRAVLRTCACALIATFGASAQDATTFNNRVTGALQRMAASDLSERESGFDDLMSFIGDNSGGATSLPDFLGHHRDLADRITLALIKLLNGYNYLFVNDPNPPGTYTEDDSEEYAAAIQVVGELDDERAIPALVGAMTSGSIAHAGILKYGLTALGPVCAELTNQDPLIRYNAVGVGVTILEEDHSAKSHAQALDIIRTALEDLHFVVRSMALEMIEKLSDRAQFSSALQDMANHDPHIMEQPGKAPVYPLRNQAAVLLQKIKKH
jgi:hypothetical protein